MLKLVTQDKQSIFFITIYLSSKQYVKTQIDISLNIVLQLLSLKSKQQQF